MLHKQIGCIPNYFALCMLIIGYYHHSVCMDTPSKSISEFIAAYNMRNNSEVHIDPSAYYWWLSQQVWLDAPPPQASERLNAALHLITRSKSVTTTRSLQVSKQHAHASVLLALGHVATQERVAYTIPGLHALWHPLQTTLSDDHLNMLLDTLTLRATSIPDYHRQKRFIVAALIIAGADANRTSKYSGLSPLGEAVLYDDTAGVDLLIQHGANPNSSFMRGNPMPIIWYTQSLATTRLLISRGARLPTLTNPSECDTERYEQLRALFEHAEE